MQNGLVPISPDKRDYSLLPTFGATAFDTASLPKSFSVYDGRPIPDQNVLDTRFTPPVRPLPYGCVGEATTFDAGIQDGKLYRPDFPFDKTPPYRSDQGRDIRAVLKTLINTGLQDDKGNIGNKRTAYFNVYGAGKIDDFDAARIAIWINQDEKRSVIAGTYWYPDDWNYIQHSGMMPTPSYVTKNALLHCHLVTGFETTYKDTYLEDISWQGEDYGHNGRTYFSREQWNRLMAQASTGQFTVSKVAEGSPLITLGMSAHFDHVAYALRDFIRNLYHLWT